MAPQPEPAADLSMLLGNLTPWCVLFTGCLSVRWTCLEILLSLCSASHICMPTHRQLLGLPASKDVHSKLRRNSSHWAEIKLAQHVCVSAQVVPKLVIGLPHFASSLQFKCLVQRTAAQPPAASANPVGPGGCAACNTCIAAFECLCVAS